MKISKNNYDNIVITYKTIEIFDLNIHNRIRESQCRFINYRIIIVFRKQKFSFSYKFFVRFYFLRINEKTIINRQN